MTQYEEIVTFESDEPVAYIERDEVTAPPYMHRDLDDTFDVLWKREGEDEIFECRDLTILQFIRRLIGANHNFGEITIVRVERVRRDRVL